MQSPFSLLSHSAPVTAAVAKSDGYSEGRNTNPTKPRMSKHWWQELPPEREGQPEHPQHLEPQSEFQKALRLLQPIHFSLESPVRKDPR
jgi:hypothetical protein